jgi:hypothetical protein
VIILRPLGTRRRRQILFRITRESRDHFIEERLGDLRFLLSWERLAPERPAK